MKLIPMFKRTITDNTVSSHSAIPLMDSQMSAASNIRQGMVIAAIWHFPSVTGLQHVLAI